MSSSLRRLVLFLACAFAAASAAAQAAAGAAAGAADSAPALKLAVSRGPVSLLIYVAHARGLFKSEGVAVELVDCASGRQCFGLLADGRADLATAAELVVALDGFNDSEAAILATLSNSSRHIKLIARRNAGIAEPADLRGKRIGTVAGTSAHYFLDSWLLYHAIDPDGADIRALAPEQLVGALAEREVDAVAIWEPTAVAAMRAIGSDALAMHSAGVYTQHFNLVATRAGVVRHRAAVVRLLRALGEAERIVGAEPAQARAILNQRLGSDSSAASMAEHDFRLTLSQSLVSTMDAQMRWARRDGHAPAHARPGGVLRLIEPALLRQVAPAAVTLLP